LPIALIEDCGFQEDWKLDAVRVWRWVLTRVLNDQLVGQEVEREPTIGDHIGDKKGPVGSGINFRSYNALALTIWHQVDDCFVRPGRTTHVFG
jgi:hypothetical protein